MTKHPKIQTQLIDCPLCGAGIGKVGAVKLQNKQSKAEEAQAEKKT